MSCNNETFKEIQDILKENGKVPESTKTRLILLAMLELHECMSEMNDNMKRLDNIDETLKTHEDRLDKLEKSNLIGLLHKNPKVGITTIIVGVFLLIMLIANYYPQIKQVLDLVSP